LGLQETTAVVFFSDHGYKLGEHGSWTKGTNLEEDTRVPLLFHTPLQFFSDQRRPPLRRLQATSISSIMFENSVVELVDVFLTLIDLCGLTPLPIGSQVLEGASLTPLLLDHSELGTNNKRRYHRLSRHKARHHQESNKVNDNSLIPKREKDYGCGAAFSQVLSGKIMGYSLRYSCEGEGVRHDVVGHHRSGYRLTVWMEFATRALSNDSRENIEEARVDSIGAPLGLLFPLPEKPSSSSSWLNIVCNSQKDLSKGNLTLLGERVSAIAAQDKVRGKVPRLTTLEAIELYDLDTDPYETENVANEIEYAPILGMLTCQWVRGWRGSHWSENRE
jgi:hypothetical protein